MSRLDGMCVSKPLVSVLIPCFNAEKYVGETLESVLRQSWSNIEIIVVNDGSTDGSLNEIRRFNAANLTVLDRVNAGAAASRNEAFRRSSGAFIQFLDADDILDSEKIAAQIRQLEHEPNSLSAATWERFYRRIGDWGGARGWIDADLDPLEWLACDRRDGLGMMLPAMWLIPRQVTIDAGPWREDLTLADDTEYFTRIVLASSRVLFCRDAHCYYRSGIQGSLSGRKSPAAWASQFKVTELCETHVRARDDSERTRRSFALSWQYLAHACYPYDPVLAELALGRARSLHSIRIRADGGPKFQAVARLIGWRSARRLQVASGGR
jgi:glycosyltransferase involved in cell wall biosynthesis